MNESYNDVNSYSEFFKNKLNYHKVSSITDKSKIYQSNLRSKILDAIESMKSGCTGIGRNPYTVNVITFSGHGFTLNGDTIAVIPEYNSNEKEKSDKKEARFINFSGLARKLAQCKHTLNIFIMSIGR